MTWIMTWLLINRNGRLALLIWSTRQLFFEQQKDELI